MGDYKRLHVVGNDGRRRRKNNLMLDREERKKKRKREEEGIRFGQRGFQTWIKIRTKVKCPCLHSTLECLDPILTRWGTLKLLWP